MTRIRPTAADRRKAREMDWYETHADRLEHLGNDDWQVFLTDDVYDHRVHSVHKSLGEAIRVARELLAKPDGP